MRQVLTSDFIVSTVNFMLQILIDQNNEILDLCKDDIKKIELNSKNDFIKSIIEFLEASKKDLFNINKSNYYFRTILYKDGKVIFTAKDFSTAMQALKLDYDYFENCVVVDTSYSQQYKLGG